MIIKSIRYVVSLSVILIFAGCYTQFALVDKAVPETINTVVDSVGDTVKVIKQTDTVFQKEHDVCVWERDLLGYPHLRCYKSFYPRDWFVYQNTPWWYRNDPFWGDIDRCPRYYYYDSDCGCCRYSVNRYDYFGRDFDRDHRFRDGGFSGRGSNGWSGGGASSSDNGSSNNGTAGSSGYSLQNKDTRTTATKISEPRSSVPPVGIYKVAPVETAPAVPQTGVGVNETPKSDNVESVKKRDIRSLRSR